MNIPGSLQCMKEGQPQSRSTDGVRIWVRLGGPSKLLLLVVSAVHSCLSYGTNVVGMRGMLEQLEAASSCPEPEHEGFCLAQL